MKNFNREEFKRGNIAVHCEFHKSKGMKIIEWEIDKIKEIEEDNKDMSEFADYLIENASYAKSFIKLYRYEIKGAISYENNRKD